MWFNLIRSLVRWLLMDGHAGGLRLELYGCEQSAQCCEHFKFVDIVVRNSIISYFSFYFYGNLLHSVGNLRSTNTIMNATLALSQNSGIWGFSFKNCSLTNQLQLKISNVRYFVSLESTIN